MADTLYIIGNGFDLHHGIRTSYSNFRKDYACKKTSLWENLETIYGTKLYDNLWWKDFEKMLGEVDYEHLTKSYNGEALGASKVSNLLRRTLPALFGEWINGVDIKVEEDKTLMIDTDALFFTFNYTLLLEKIYHVNDDKIWHIHDSVRNVDKVVIGHDFNSQELFLKSIEYQKTNPSVNIRLDTHDWIDQELANCAKKVKNRILLNETKFSKYAEIKHIIVMGFSFNTIDMPYIEKIWKVNKYKEEVDWTLYWHNEGENKYMKKKLCDLGVKESSIKELEFVDLKA